ncbi:MAG TPA: CHAT domain-containing protein, partial [Thermoanaerobaculia bacterium]|nr:CHAT domain-containing protein [Thermoanaerobaculia bacterium]
AFLEAGVPTVIATLWKIDDEASKAFFTRLHEHLRGGTRPAQALRATQVEFMKRGASPSIWAAVQCIGS